MRLAAQERCGFYPAPDKEVEEMAKHLQLGNPTERCKEFTILDPCAGEAKALKILADALHIPSGNIFAIELDKARGAAVRENLPGTPAANILAPCSFFSSLISHRTFSAVYLNPPFDDQLGGGGRDETEFVKEAYTLLQDNGVLILVCPLRTMQKTDMRMFVDSHFKDCELYRFHEPQYGEVVMFGRKRTNPLEDKDVYNSGALAKAYKLDRYGREYDYQLNRYRGINDLKELPAVGTLGCTWKDGMPGETHKTIRVWTLPPTWRPSRFAKSGYLPEELIEELGKSPLNDLYRAASEPDIAEAPLPLAEGHVALLVASGALDGLVEVPYHPQLNHAMRGIARKIERPNEEASSCVLSEDGKSMKVKEVYSEEQDTRIRAIDKTFQIFDFDLKPSKETKARETEVAIETTEGEPGTVVVPLIREGDSDYIMIDCGGGHEVKFCFDTGAETCCIGTDQLKGVEYFATGRTTVIAGVGGLTQTCKEILVASMSVQGLTAKNVRAFVVDGKGSSTCDSLLGQNFLRLFDYSYSQRRAELTLTLAEKEEAEAA